LCPDGQLPGRRSPAPARPCGTPRAGGRFPWNGPVTARPRSRARAGGGGRRTGPTTARPRARARAGGLGPRILTHPGGPNCPPAGGKYFRQTGAFKFARSQLPPLTALRTPFCTPGRPLLSPTTPTTPAPLRPAARPCPVPKNARGRRLSPPEWPHHCQALRTGLVRRRRPPFLHTPVGPQLPPLQPANISAERRT